MDEVTVVVLDKKENVRKNFSISIKSEESIDGLLGNVGDLTKIPKNELEVLFCGKMIERGTRLRDLQLTPATQLTLLRPKVTNPTLKGDNLKTATSTTTISSFFVFCKQCDQVKRGKLRVYCEKCQGTSILVKNEPQNWSDVLKSKRIKVSCENCQKDDLYANFRFKCVTCNEICAALTHARGNWQKSECCICADEDPLVFDLGCNHLTCLQCFRQYLEANLENFNFSLKPPHGFTITCPFTDCSRVVQDVHHFYVMGKAKYQEYQKKATEKLVLLDDEGVTCPNPKCGQSFFWEPYDDDGRSQCPDCYFTFCRKCNERDCICHQADDLTRTTIEATTRKCPRCQTSTERNGGCAHIHCTNCGFDWCFKCVAEWTENCQWDHWF